MKPLASDRPGLFCCLLEMTTKTTPSAQSKTAADGKGVRKPGRPRKYETPADFDAAVKMYVSKCSSDKDPITWTGMALALGFTSREAIDEYAHYEGFSDSVKRAKLIVQNAYEIRLFGQTPTGAIFALKNFGWSDKREVEHSGNLRVVMSALDEDL